MRNAQEVDTFFEAAELCKYTGLKDETKLNLLKLSRALPANEMLKRLAMLTSSKSESELGYAKALQAKLTGKSTSEQEPPGSPPFAPIPNNLIDFYPVPENFLESNETVIGFKQEVITGLAQKVQVSGAELMIPCYQNPMNVFKLFATKTKKERLRGVRYGNAIFVYREYKSAANQNTVNYFVDEFARNQDGLGDSKALDDMLEYFAHKVKDEEKKVRYILLQPAEFFKKEYSGCLNLKKIYIEDGGMKEIEKDLLPKRTTSPVPEVFQDKMVKTAWNQQEIDVTLLYKNATDDDRARAYSEEKLRQQGELSAKDNEDDFKVLMADITKNVVQYAAKDKAAFPLSEENRTNVFDEDKDKEGVNIYLAVKKQESNSEEDVEYGFIRKEDLPQN